MTGRVGLLHACSILVHISILKRYILVSNDDILYPDCDVTFHINLLDTTQSQIHMFITDSDQIPVSGCHLLDFVSLQEDCI